MKKSSRLVKLARMVCCLGIIAQMVTGCGIVPCGPAQMEPAPETETVEAIPPENPERSTPSEGVILPEKEIPNSQPLFNEAYFLLHHAQIMESYQHALEQREIPLYTDMKSDLRRGDMLTYDMKCGDQVVAKVICSYGTESMGGLQKLYFSDLREENGENPGVTQEQMLAAARLFVGVTHGAMTEVDWELVDTADQQALVMEEVTGQTHQMTVARLDGVDVYWENANWAIAISGAIDPQTGALTGAWI